MVIVGVYCWPLLLTSAAADSTTAAATEPTADQEFFADFAALDLASLLDTEVEVATGFRQRLANIPAVVEVMTAAEIQRLGIRDLRELILYMTGTYEWTNMLSPQLTRGIRLRGGAVSDRLMILIESENALDDNDELYDPYLLPIDAIERAEFLRGPAAVLYGSSAMSGVLRLSLKRPTTGWSAGGRLAGDPLGKGGEAALFTAMSATNSTFGWRADVQLRQTETRNYVSSKDERGLPGNYSGQTTYESALFSLYLGDWRLRLRQNIVQFDVVSVTNNFAANPDDSSLKTSYAAELAYDKALQQDWRFLANIGVAYNARNFDIGVFPPATTPTLSGLTLDQHRTRVDLNGITSKFEASARKAAKSWHSMIGLQYRNLYQTEQRWRLKNLDNRLHPLSPPADGNSTIHDINLLGQGGLTVIEDIDFLLGARLNIFKPQAFGLKSVLTADEASPPARLSPMARAATVWRTTTTTTLKALYGRSFRLPTMRELFTEVVPVIVATPNLKPETQHTAELIADYRPLERLSIQINGFYNWIQDSIQYVFTFNQAVQGSFTNLTGTLRTYGFDTTTRWVATTWLDGFFSLTYHEGRDYDGSYLREMPRSLGKTWFTFSPLTQRKLELTPIVLFRGPVGSADSDVVVNAVALWRPLTWLTLDLTALNIFGADPVVEISEYPTFGESIRTLEQFRSLRLGIAAQF